MLDFQETTIESDEDRKGRASDQSACEALELLCGLHPCGALDLGKPMAAALGIFDQVQAERASAARRGASLRASLMQMNRLYSTMNRLYVDTREAQNDMATMLKRCAHRLRQDGHADLADKAVDLLKKHDLAGTPLRSGLSGPGDG